MAAGGDEIQVAANAGLGGMDVAEIVSAIDNPKFSVAGGEVENLFFLGQDDECQEAQFRLYWNDVILRVLHNTRRVGRGTSWCHAKGQDTECTCKQNSEDATPRIQG